MAGDGQTLGVSRNAVYGAARRGDFRTIRIGKRILVPRSEIHRLLTGGANSHTAGLNGTREESR